MRTAALSLCLALAAAPAMAEAPRVVTDIPAVQSLVAQVMGDLGTPEVMLDRGADAHHYQMRPSQARALQQADLVVWIGPEMTPWLDRAIAGMSGANQLALLKAPGTFRRDFDEAAHAHGAADETDSSEAGHTHDGLDPHAWLDPENARHWLDLVAARLGSLDPENAVSYAANAAKASQHIAELEAEIAAQLHPVADKPFVVAHDAFGYFAGHFGLHVAGSVAMGDAAEPGAAHLAELREDLIEDGIVCVFPEAQHDPRQIETLIEGTPVRLGRALDPSGSGHAYGADLYAALLRDLADGLTACLSAP